MKAEEHQEIYRIAHDAANADLTEIAAEVERLRVRKDHVEKLIAVLKPIIGIEEQTAPVPAKEEVVADGTAERVEAAPGAQNREEQAQPLGVGADPFQRRVDHVLGIGAGIRDVRQYTRQF